MSEDSADLMLAFKILPRAIDGDMEPLAKWIEEGKGLDRATRDFLAAHLRGRAKPKPTRARTFAQQFEESHVMLTLHSLKELETEIAGARGAMARAKERYLDLDPRMTDRRLKRYISNYNARMKLKGRGRD